MVVRTIRGGEMIDIPTADETAAAVDQRYRAFYAEQQEIESARQREKLRGIKDLQMSTLLTTPAGTHVTVSDGITPDAGYKWVIRLLGVYLSAAGTGQAFITSDPSSALGGRTQGRVVASFLTSGAYQVQTYGGGALILDEGEGLYFNFTQNVAGYILNGWITPAEMIGRFS